MKSALLSGLLFLALPVMTKATDEAREFKIDFLCCGVNINCFDPAYSNAVLEVLMPYFQDFAGKLDLPMPQLNDATGFLPGHTKKTRDQLEGGGYFNGHGFAFEEGHVFAYGSPTKYAHLQDFTLLDKSYGQAKMTKAEAVAFARRAIKKLGYSLEEVLADYEPVIPPLEQFSTNILPRYHIKWVDPRHGGGATEFEINANEKKIEAVRFNYNHNLKRPAPKLNVEPAPLDPAHYLQKLWISQNNWTNDINHEYGYRLVPVVFKAVEDWARKLNLDLPLPITTNQVRRFYCSNNGGVPYVELSLTNGWEFVYRTSDITYAGSPRRFFESDKLPFRIKTFAGTKRLTDSQAIELARKTVAKLGYGPEITHTDMEPKLMRPKVVAGMPTIPRLMIEWVYPNPQVARSVWIVVEVDCDKGAVEALQYDVTALWKKGPDLGVPIDNPAKQSVEK